MDFLRWFLAVLATLASVTAGLAVLVIGLVALIFVTEPTETGGSARVAGLGGNVTVTRDTNSIPHIFAGNRLDAYRALGFVHAQDRFFQMELARRTAAGRLSEVVGPFGLRGDRFMRTLGVYRLAEATVASLTPEARAAVDAYAEGVNAWLESPDTQRPAELIALGITPEAWRPADSAAWVRLMALLLAGDWRTEILKTQLSEFLSDDQLRDLWPGEPDQAPTTMALSADLRKQLTALSKPIPDIFPEASASNEWVVSGARSVSGKPLLANDPHLGLSAPGMWHLARIVTPDFEASGGAIPGQPFFMVGQNGFLSWGLTTTHADTQDLYIERLDPNDPNRYLTPDGSAAFETRIEEIKVRGRSEPEHLTVRTTRHGPVISDISSDALTLGGDGTVVSLAFAALREDDGTANAIYGMNSAQTVAQFLTAASNFQAPMQNIAYAHVDGRFGFVSAGRLPVRPGGPGDQPRPGWTGEYDWAGFVPFAELPRSHNPRTGFVVNANNRVAPRDYPHVIANDWPEGFRAARILDLLAETPQHTAESFAVIQTDVVSPGAIALTKAMLDALPGDEKNQALLRSLAEWDGDMARERAEPLVFAALSRNLRQQLVADELGEFAGGYRGPPTRAMIAMLTTQTDWCDNVLTPGTEDCAIAVTQALHDTVTELESTYGDTPDTWRWGDSHIAPFAHPLFRFAGPLAKWFGTNIATNGGDHTINRGTYRSSGDGRYPHVHGAGLRAIFDMSDPGAARYMIAPGQSGKMTSPHFSDLARPWAEGKYIVLQGDEDTLRSTASSELILTP